MKSNVVKTARLKDKVAIAQAEAIPNIWNGTMFGDLDWPPNASHRFVSISWASCLTNCAGNQFQRGNPSYPPQLPPKWAWIGNFRPNGPNITSSSADADKPARRLIIYIYNRVGRCAAELLSVFYFQKAAVRHLGFWRFCAVVQNLVKIGLSAAELLCIFDFQNGGRPPSWIWYDVMADQSS